MSIELLATLANLLAAIGVLASLFYLARQVRQGNKLARAAVRQRMAEQATGELYAYMNDADLRACFTDATLTPEQHSKLHAYLLSTLRQREWEWFQVRDGIITEDVQRAYTEVIGLFLGIERTRRWWRKLGKIGFNAEFVAMVDGLIEGRPTITYFDDILVFDLPEPTDETSGHGPAAPALSANT